MTLGLAMPPLSSSPTRPIAPAASSTPTATHRLELIDALRGFALFGVLLVNLRSFSLFEFMGSADRALLPTAGWDRLLDGAMALLVDGRSITLFSLLFGLGFALQMQRAGDSLEGMRRHVRRMGVLLAIGLAHAWLLWWGDILRYYAVCGLLLLAFTGLRARTLAWLGAIVAVVLPVLLQPIVAPWLPRQAGMAEAAAAASQAFGSSDFATMLDGNLARDLRMRIAIWWLPLFVLGRLLIGMALGRADVLRQSVAHRRFWRRLLAASFAATLVATVLLMLRDQGAAEGIGAWLRHDASGRIVTRLLREAAPLAQGLFYMAAFVLLFQRAAWRHWLRKLAPLGRMALSNYLVQTLAGLSLFYGVGLGIGPKFGLVGVALACVAIFALQAAASCWWLRRYRLGPVEWAWRSLVQGRMAPMRSQREERA